MFNAQAQHLKVYVGILLKTSTSLAIDFKGLQIKQSLTCLKGQFYPYEALHTTRILNYVWYHRVTFATHIHIHDVSQF